MESMDLYEEFLEKRIANLEKRMRWIKKDMFIYSEMLKQLPKKPKSPPKILQLELFGG